MAQLFQYAIIWHPTEKQVKDEGKKSEIIVELKTILANDLNSANIQAARAIPEAKLNELDQIQLVVKPF
jgi:hypothetical protein